LESVPQTPETSGSVGKLTALLPIGTENVEFGFANVDAEVVVLSVFHL
jgi:hypothetical protein